MKKLLMLGAILVLGATAFAKGELAPNDENVVESNVTVKAQLVAENLVISDLEGNPLVLDFEKININEQGIRKTDEGLLIKYVGAKELDPNHSLTMELKGEKGFAKTAVPVTLAALEQVEGKAADTFEAVVGLNSYTGKLTEGTKYVGEVYEGKLYGTVNCKTATANGVDGAGIAKLSTGDYEGHTVLKVTLANPVI